METNAQKNDLLKFSDTSDLKAYLQSYFEDASIQNELEFTKVLRKWAKKGDAQCQSLLGLCYQIGFGCIARMPCQIKRSGFS